jgi:hypothetical protein
MQEVQDASAAQAMPWRIGADFVKDTSEKIYAISHAVAKDKVDRAQAQLQSELAAKHDELNSKENYTVAEVRDQLKGDISPQTKAFLEGKADNEQVPTWQVAGELFDSHARGAQERARQMLGSGLGQVVGVDAGELTQRVTAEYRRRVNDNAAKQMGAYLQASAVSTAQKRLNTATLPQDYDAIREGINASGALPATVKMKLLEDVGQAQDKRPILGALQSDNAIDLATQLGQLNDPKAKPNLTPDQREQYAQAIKGHLSALDRKNDPDRLRKLRDQEMHDTEERTWAKLVNAIDGGGFKGKGPDAELQLMKMLPDPTAQSHEENLRQRKYIEDNTKPIPPKDVETDDALYAQLSNLIHDDPESFKNGTFMIDGKPTTLLQLRVAKRLSKQDFRSRTDLQRQMREQPGSPVVKGFMSDEEVVNAALQSYGLDPHSKDPGTLVQVGRAKQLINAAIIYNTPDAKKPLDSTAKTEIINSTLRAHFKKGEGFLGSSAPSEETKDFRPDIVSGWDEAKRRKVVDVPLTAKFAKDYEDREPGIQEAWARTRPGKPLDTALAITIWRYVELHRGDLQARLKRQGVDITNQTALAELAIQDRLGK